MNLPQQETPESESRTQGVPFAKMAGPSSAQRLWIALRRFILGRSDWDYLKQYTGSDAYWDNAIAAQNGWPKSQSPKEQS
jgi:hypothetical protein